ncbi:cytochrome c oxidase subunit 7B [Megalopta genalis]|uniref:cytochrome c oxidase subunit 7B n=1 Tax=Megalopta genalis TaxID=115081 RepID=UPI003FD465E3
MFRHLLRPVRQITRPGTRSMQIPNDVRPPHMDELLVPQGCWKTAYEKNQRRYNMHLAAGVIGLIGTIAIGRATGWLWLNYSAPVPK